MQNEPMQSGHVEELISCCPCSCLVSSDWCKIMRELLTYRHRPLQYGIAQER